jgi:hypothetical protein
MTGRKDIGSTARSALAASAAFWWAVTAIGQWIFAAYIAAYFGPKLLQGGIEGLKQTHLANGFIPGDAVGNAIVAAHVVFAVIIMGVGPLQLIPQLRARLPVLHHWTGRAYLLAAVTSSIGGLYLIWTRPLFGALANNIGTSLSGVLVVLFAAVALRHAIARDIPTHQRWALRLFMVASSVWFLRMGVYLWGLLAGGVGMDFKTFSGPVLAVWHFGQYLLPLAVLEIYLRARDGTSARFKLATATLLIALTLLMVVAIFLLAMTWLQRI